MQYALTPKPKKPAPVDRGKLDDIRFSVPAYGAAIVKAYGTFRCAPTWFWHTPAIDLPITTPGQQGGKGGGGNPPSPDVTEHRYFKSAAGVFHDGQIQYVRRIWFNAELVWNMDGPTQLSSTPTGTSSTRYEAEFGVLQGTAAVTAMAEASEGRKVTGLGSGANAVTIHCDVSSTAIYEVAIAYTSPATRTLNLSVNGGGVQSLSCPTTDAGLVAVKTMRLSLTAGANTLTFGNAGAAAPDLDYITIAPALTFTDTPSGPQDRRSFTGIQAPGRVAPTDPDIFWPVNDEIPTFSDPSNGLAGGGNYAATLAKWGNPQIRIYVGSEEQLPDPLIESIKGVGNTSAYRGTAYIVIEGLQMQNGQFPNVTIEFVEGTRQPAAIITDLARMVGLTPANDLDVTALNGLILGDNSGFSAGTYSAITWSGLNNATQTSGGAISKTSGANNTWNAYAVQGTTVSAGTDAAIRFTAGAGVFMIGFSTTATPGSALPNPYNQVLFGILLNVNSNPSQETKNAIQMSLGGSNNTTDIGVWNPGDDFQIEIRNGRFNLYQNGLLMTGFTPPPATFPLHPIYMGYSTGGGPSAASYATGANIGSEPQIVDAGAVVIDQQREAAEILQELMIRFQFIMPEVDGKVKAILLDSASEFTLAESECQAYRGDGLPPKIEISRQDPLRWPKYTIVNYSDPQLDYHNNSQVETRLYGPQKGTRNITLSMVESGLNMKKLAAIISTRAEVEGQIYRFTLGPKYKRIHQGTVLTITEGSATHVVRVTNTKPDLPAGLIEVDAVRKGSVFDPNVVVQEIGVEVPIVPVPGNTKGVIIDGPLLRPEDAGDGTQPVVYVAMTGRGSGNWPAGLAHREFPIDTGNYIILATSDKPSNIGVTDGTLASVTDPSIWNRTGSLVINFYSNTQLSSATESDLLANPTLNLLGVINPITDIVEYIQFKTAVAGVAVAPYMTKYTISVFLRGRLGTHSAVAAHSSADDVVVMDSTVIPVRMNLSDVGRALRFKFLTAGQAIDVVEATTQTLRGQSLKPFAPSGLRGTRDQPVTLLDGSDLLVRWRRESRLAPGMRPSVGVPIGEEVEEYDLEIYDGSTLKRTMSGIKPGLRLASFFVPERPRVFASDGAYAEHNSVSAGVGFNGNITARTAQEIPAPNNTFDGTLTVFTSSDFAFVGLGRFGGAWTGIANTLTGLMPFGATLTGLTAIPYLVILEYLGSDEYRLSVYEYGTRIFSASSDSGAGDYSQYFGWHDAFDGTVGQAQIKVRFNIIGSTVLIQKNDKSGSGYITIVSSKVITEGRFPMHGLAGASGDALFESTVSNSFITTGPEPATIYSRSQQVQDFGSVQSSVKVRVYQLSAIIGRGDYVEGTI